MKKVLLLLFLLPLAVFGQSIDVWDGDGATPAADIDSLPADATSYMGTWQPSFDLWQGYEEGYYIHIRYEFYWTGSGQFLYGVDYPAFFNTELAPVQVSHTVTITEGDIGELKPDGFQPGDTFFLRAIARATPPGELFNLTDIATQDSNGVTIEGGEEPPPG